MLTKCWSTMLQTKPPPATQKWFVPRPCDQHHVMSFSSVEAILNTPW